MEVQDVALFVLYKNPLGDHGKGVFTLVPQYVLRACGIALPFVPASRQKVAIRMANIGYLDF